MNSRSWRIYFLVLCWFPALGRSSKPESSSSSASPSSYLQQKMIFLVPTAALVVMMRHYRPESGEYIQIFEYSNIFVRNIYSDIHLSQFCLYKYIWTFVCECENSNIWIFIQLYNCTIFRIFCITLRSTFLQLELFVHQC